MSSFTGNNSAFQIGFKSGRIDTEFLPLDKACLRDLKTTDPHVDRRRTIERNGGLLKDTYSWVLDHKDFQQWLYGEKKRVLWIEGGPGMGKTMMLKGILDELEKLTPGMFPSKCFRAILTAGLAKYAFWMQHSCFRDGTRLGSLKREDWYERRKTWLHEIMNVMQIQEDDIMEEMLKINITESRSEKVDQKQIVEHFVASVNST